MNSPLDRFQRLQQKVKDTIAARRFSPEQRKILRETDPDMYDFIMGIKESDADAEVTNVFCEI